MRKLILNLDVPPDVMLAAEKVALWAKTKGFKDWAIGPVADRAYLERIIAAVEGNYGWVGDKYFDNLADALR